MVFREMWEKKPALIRRHNPEYYKGLFSTTEIDRILREVSLCSFRVYSHEMIYTVAKHV